MKKAVSLLFVLAFVFSCVAGVAEVSTYTATYRGYTSDITVDVDFGFNAISDVRVVSEKETNGIGSYAIDALPKRILAEQTCYVDMVSGATATSAAIRAGVADCLRQAGADMSVFGRNSEDPAPIDAAYNCDVVVIGAGAAGLTAAYEALCGGASVIVVEKMDIPGGNTVRSSGAWNVAAHPDQLAIHATNDNLVPNRTTVEDFVEYTMTGGHDINDIELVTYMVENSAPITDWMRSLGFNCEFSGNASSTSVPGVARGLITGMKDRVVEKGGMILLSSKAESILTNDEGAACGIKGTTSTSGALMVNAKAVVVATGGFGRNLEMVYELKPEYEGFISNNQVGATGDGIIMAQAIGADVVDMEQIQAHPTVHQASANMLTEGCRGAGGILLNTSGKRFIDECTYRDIVANAILEQDQQYAYLLINQAIVDSNVNIAGYIDVGILKGPFETIEDVAEFMNADTASVRETFDAWNGYVANENDPEFNSSFTWIRDLSEGPWYCAQVAPGIHHTMGGLKINTSTEVIATTGEAIPGLFAAGEVTGGVHGGNRVGGNAILDCLVFGKTAGDSSAVYALNHAVE
ncbi:MAG: flavocytochrome c [Clostridia bacterium]|nr:flavocytochrome c [Clostridia bacterium]